jgi:threonine/homoserine/homoserine lactone efflux protein
VFGSDSVYWISVTLACLLGAMAPGPSLGVVFNYALSVDRRVGIYCALAHAIAIAVYAAISAFGLLTIFHKSAAVFNIVQLLGILFLVLLAIKLLTGSNNPTSLSTSAHSNSRWQAARDGFLIAFVNPKVMLFFTALFSQFLREDMNYLDKLSLVLIASVVDGLWYLIVVLMITKATAMIKLQQQVWVVDKLFGVFLLLISVYFLNQLWPQIVQN